MMYRLGTRKSALAKTQSNWVKNLLSSVGIECQLVEITSAGDADRKTPLYEIDSQTPGLFTKELEGHLISGDIDLAVHSLKDLPTLQPPELRIAAISAREAAEDCLVTRLLVHSASNHGSLPLPVGARVGTSSLRREAQLLSARPDVNVIPIRGNVPTRVQMVIDGKVDAIVLARAGLNRLDLDLGDLVRWDLPATLFAPAPGQGALAVETRKSIPEALEVALAKIHSVEAERETRAERRVLQGLHGGCTLPLGVRCHTKDHSNRMSLRAFLGVCEGAVGTARQWISFHHFDINDEEEDTLVENTVAHFKKIMEKT